MEPHALDLGSDRWMLAKSSDSVLKRRKRIAVDGGAGRPVNQFVKTVILATVGEFGPSLKED
jgi:hypothetical protein